MNFFGNNCWIILLIVIILLGSDNCGYNNGCNNCGCNNGCGCN